MAIDQTAVGLHITAQMDAIEADYKDAEVISIVTIVELRTPDGESVPRVRWQALDAYRVVGLLEAGKMSFLLPEAAGEPE